LIFLLAYQLEQGKNRPETLTIRSVENPKLTWPYTVELTTFVPDSEIVACGCWSSTQNDIASRNPRDFILINKPPRGTIVQHKHHIDL
jgi:hypothetical protein